MVLVAIWLIAQANSFGQHIADTKKVEITFNKTSSLVFPSSIVSVDRGSRDVLAQKAQGVQNVLQLKAARANFPETNLTVITSDGMLHHFLVSWSRLPKVLASGIINEEDSITDKTTVDVPVIFATGMTEPQMEQYSEAITEQKRSVRLVNDRSYKMKLSLLGIYSVDDIMFFSLEVGNRSNISYDVDHLRFYIRDSRKAKRSSSQELVVEPRFVHGDDERVKGRDKQNLVYAVDKFTIPDAKKLYIQVMERSGGRHLLLKIRNRTIAHARPIAL